MGARGDFNSYFRLLKISCDTSTAAVHLRASRLFATRWILSKTRNPSWRMPIGRDVTAVRVSIGRDVIAIRARRAM